MKKIINQSDIVRKMREIRDKFSHEIMDMTFEEEKEYIRKQLAALKMKKHSQQNV